jgi:multidrug efflux pump subunit AcrA (membrane-fusion protein)
MHPQVETATEGECPICHMALQSLTVAVPAPPAVGSAQRAIPTDVPERTVVSRTLVAPAWSDAEGSAFALFRRDELDGLPRDASGSFASTARPAVALQARRTSQAPTPRDGSTSWVSFRLQGADGSLRVGQVGWLTVEAPPHDVLLVPSSAVRASPEGSYVLVVSSDGRSYERRPVETGGTHAGKTVILAGLAEGTRFVKEHTFFLDAEQELRPGSGRSGT